jgi:glutaredoxin
MKQRSKIKKRSKKKSASNKIQNYNHYIDGIQTKVEIYSKKGCPYCESAKEFLFAYKPNIIEYDNLSNEEKEKVQERIITKTGSEFRTYPKIFINNDFIGGFSDLVENHSNLNPTFTKTTQKKWSFF